MPTTHDARTAGRPTAAPAAANKPAAQEDLFAPTDRFEHRHIGPSEADIAEMLKLLGYASLDELTDDTVPESIRFKGQLQVGLGIGGASGGGAGPRGEFELLEELRSIAQKNQVFRSFIGTGYSDCITPAVILRNILENPGWYTQYTPYQAEISQGRLEALVNFQTMIADLTGLPLANASLLDEATAAAEAFAMCRSILGAEKAAIFVDQNCHPQTIAVVRTRAEALGIELIVGDAVKADFTAEKAAGRTFCGVLVQYPTTDGRIVDYGPLTERAHAAGVLVVVAADLLALTLLRPPGEFAGGGADIAVGSAQRFGVPMGFGGPHAAFMATRSEYARKMPGRIIGVSKDAHGNPAYRLALQTREQHIRRDKATSNICTAQVLLAIMAGMYAVYHGPEGLKKIARRVHALSALLATKLRRQGWDVGSDPFFDTLCVRFLGTEDHPLASFIVSGAYGKRYNLRRFEKGLGVGVALDETTTLEDVEKIAAVFGHTAEGGHISLHEIASQPHPQGIMFTAQDLAEACDPQNVDYPSHLTRTSSFLTHPVFHQYHSETEMLRYLTRLQARDLSLTTSMTPLGSCTMKLNGPSEMLPVSWPEFARMHPFAPAEQWQGYREMCGQLETWLAEITGFAATSLQPNAGSQGEYAGLLTIRAYHQSCGQGKRNVCLIPESAHGTNPASAAAAGMKVVVVACDAGGNVDLADLKSKAEAHKDTLAALMLTYPSTRGVFEESVRQICEIVHAQGGQVYMDGANMNAMVGLCRPGDIGADVCHLNLHKTFCIPHGGGGPGVGPICVAKHLAPFLPGHPLVSLDKGAGSPAARNPGAGNPGPGAGAVSAAPYGSAGILCIPWVYIALMGGAGLKKATQVAILNANYMAKRLEGHYQVLFVGRSGRVAHEFVVDCHPFETSADIKVDDIAKRLMDYGFHAPTMSWPVHSTLMIEPTESESKAELDRFCDALIAIRQEIRAIEEGRADRLDNALKNAPHTAAAVSADYWPHKYPREQAAYPAPWLKQHKFWPSVGRIDNPYGDRNLFCTCPPVG